MTYLTRKYFHGKILTTSTFEYKLGSRSVSVAHRVHTPIVVGSTPTSATMESKVKVNPYNLQVSASLTLSHIL